METDIKFFIPEVDKLDAGILEARMDATQSHVEKLQEDFISKVGCEFVMATSSGTGALHLAMTAVDLKRGDKLICSVNSFPSTPEVIRHFDAEPIFCDINADDFNINIDALRAILEANTSKKLKAVIVDHCGGMPANLEAIRALAIEYEILIIENASDIFGGTYNGDSIGSKYADITTFDFSPHKRESMGLGGMFATNDPALYERAMLINAHGTKTGKNERENCLNYIYDLVEIGLDYRMSEATALFNGVQFDALDSAIARRKEIASLYFEGLKDCKHVGLPVPHDEHIYSLFIIKIDKNRDSFARELLDRGIEVGLHYIPLHLLSYYKQKYELKISDHPNALRNFQHILSLPIYKSLSDSEVAYIIETIKSIDSSRI